ncbi:MAG: hypothetical protein MUF48_23080 [Pirellulaceae bacterium]|nr:hypothetical protein [Pirellulaceae bacterium]
MFQTVRAWRIDVLMQRLTQRTFRMLLSQKRAEGRYNVLKAETFVRFGNLSQERVDLGQR